MRLVVLALLLACSLDDHAGLEVGDDGSSLSTSGATSGDGDGSSTSENAGAAGSSGDQSDDAEDPRNGSTSGSEGDVDDDGGESDTDSEACDPGTHGCECFAGECLGELVCVDGMCITTGECAGPDGSEGCPCAGGECFGELQCWRGACTLECSENPLTNDAHCGGVCGNACTITGEYGGCEGGVCQPHLSECYATPGYTMSCPEICGAEGKTCTTCQFAYLGFGSEADCNAIASAMPLNNFPPNCDVTPFHSTNQTWARCCCE